MWLDAMESMTRLQLHGQGSSTCTAAHIRAMLNHINRTRLIKAVIKCVRWIYLPCTDLFCFLSAVSDWPGLQQGVLCEQARHVASKYGLKHKLKTLIVDSRPHNDFKTSVVCVVEGVSQTLT